MMERENGSTTAAVKDVTAAATDAAKTAADATKALSGSAVAEAGQVAQVAKDEMRDVVRAAGEQGKQVIDQVLETAREQVRNEAERLADAVKDIAAGVRALLEGRPEEAGAVKDYLQRAVDGLESASQTVRERGAQGLLQSATELARRKPGAFLLSAALAGFGASRVARVASDAAATSSTPTSAEVTGISGRPETISLPDTPATGFRSEIDGLAIGAGTQMPPVDDTRSR